MGEVYCSCPVCRLGRIYMRFFPPEVKTHLLSAQKEILLAFKSIIEKKIDKIEGADKAEKVEIT